MVLELAPVRLPVAEQTWCGLELMAHQAEALARASEPRILIEAPTGGGKTWAGAAPLIEGLGRGEGALFVYPTNALADDQRESLVSIVKLSGHRVGVVGPDGTVKGDQHSEVMIWRLHGGELDAAEVQIGGRTRGDTLNRVLERLPAKPLWLVTNPDTLHLLCTARYALSPAIWSRLEPCRTLVMDEFHLYRGPTLVRAITMMELARSLLGMDRIRILSATLPASSRRLLVDRLGFAGITASPSDSGRPVQQRIALETDTASDPTASMARRVQSLIPQLRSEVAAGGFVPLVVLRQSVLAAMHLEDELCGLGLSRDEIGVYRGLSSRAIRSMEAKALVLGTSALEVGIDFKTSRLLFEASAFGSFVQRLGRVGRHAEGSAVFYTDARVARAIETLGPTCDHRTLAETARAILAPDDDLAGFATSQWGSLLSHAIVQGLLARGKRLGGGSGFVARVESATEGLLAVFGSSPTPGIVSRAVDERLAEVATFRGGAGSVEVFDQRERQRRGSDELAVFEVDLPTFFRRALWTSDPVDHRRPVVVAWSKPRRLSLSLSMQTVGIGLHAPRPEQIELRVDGQATAWEVLLRQVAHVVGIFPATLRKRVSWREIVFDSADGCIALLDDDALVGAFLNEGRELEARPTSTYDR